MLHVTAIDRTDRIPVEAECLAPDQLAGMTVAEIEKLAIFHGNREMPLAELFKVSGDPSDAEIRLAGDTAAVKLVGARMASGRIVVEGDVGMHVGAEMTGGEIQVHGAASDWVGAEMTGGHIHVHGNAGHLIGGVYRGGKVGMRGGVILIDGNAGSEVGGAMRRGFIAIGGACGDFAGVSMIAGSIFVFGTPGIRYGAGMKRGTIALFGLEGAQPAILPSFRFDCHYRPDFLGVYLNELRRRQFPLRRDFLSEGVFQRHNGDLLELGKGEILSWQAS